MEWNVDPIHSSATFGVRHMMVSTVRGRFAVKSGHLEFDPAAPEQASIEVALDAASVETGDPKRDGHLRSADFFDAANHPGLHFKSTQVTPAADRPDRFDVDGILTIRGVAKPVRARVDGVAIGQGAPAGKRLGGTAQLTIDRRDFGLVWNKPLADGVLVGDQVRVEIDLAAVEEAGAQKAPLAA